MAARLVTSVVSESPRVLVVGEVSWLRRNIADFFRHHDFQVELAETNSLSDLDLGQGWYKVIFIPGLSENDLINSFNLSMAKLVLAAEKLVVIGTFVDNNAPVLVDLLKTLRRLSPASSLVLGKDILSQEDPQQLPMVDFYRAGEQQLLVSNKTYHLQTQDDFFNQVKAQLLLPRQVKVLILGSEQSSQVIVNEINRSYLDTAGNKFPVENDDQKNHFTLVDFADMTVVNSESKPLPTLLYGFVKTLPQYHRAHIQVAVEQQISEELRFASAPTSSTPLPSLSFPSPTPELEMESKLQNIFAENITIQKKQNKWQEVGAFQQILKKVRRRQRVFWSGLVFVGMALASLVLFSFYHTTFNWVKQDVFDLQNHSQSDSLVLLLETQNDLYSLLLPDIFLADGQTMVQIAHNLSSAKQNYQELDQLVKHQLAAILGEAASSGQSPQFRQELISNAGQLLARLEEQNAEPEIKNDWKNRYQNILIYQQLESVLPVMLAKDQKRTYVLLLQNEQEVRPTGGFLQAVAILTVDRGVLVDVNVQSIYDLDQRIAGKPTPPLDLQLNLKEKTWNLPDANWSPDFQDSASQIKILLESALNKKIDGVAAISVKGLQRWVAALGPIELSGYNEVITDKNLAERMEFHSELVLTEQSEKKDYSQALLTAVLQKIQQTPSSNLQSWLSATKQNLTDNLLLISFQNPDEAAIWQQLGWSGVLALPNCPPSFVGVENCIVDGFAAIDANVGINKANYHTTRTDSHSVHLSPTSARHAHTIFFTNSATSNAWPKGSYNSYLRFYLPLNAQNASLSVNGVQVDKSQVIVSKNETWVTLGINTQTAIQTQTKLELTYSVPYQVESNNFAYTLFSFSQLGLPSALQSVQLSYDPILTPVLVAPKAEIVQNQVDFKLNDFGHSFVGVSFGKKD